MATTQHHCPRPKLGQTPRHRPCSKCRAPTSPILSATRSRPLVPAPPRAPRGFWEGVLFGPRATPVALGRKRSPRTQRVSTRSTLTSSCLTKSTSCMCRLLWLAIALVDPVVSFCLRYSTLTPATSLSGRTASSIPSNLSTPGTPASTPFSRTSTPSLATASSPPEDSRRTPPRFRRFAMRR